MNTPCAIRPAHPEDAADLAALLHGIGWFSSFDHDDAQSHTTRLMPLLTPSEHQLQLLAHGPQGQLLGYCAVHWLPLAILQGWEGYVSELFIAEPARGMGLGRQLLEQAVAAARHKGCSRIWLVNNRDRDSYLRGFYAQQGWQEQPQAARFVLTL